MTRRSTIKLAKLQGINLTELFSNLKDFFSISPNLVLFGLTNIRFNYSSCKYSCPDLESLIRVPPKLLFFLSYFQNRSSFRELKIEILTKIFYYKVCLTFVNLEKRTESIL